MLTSWIERRIIPPRRSQSVSRMWSNRVVNAVRCAQQIQSRFRAYNADKAPAEQLHLRIGIHLGDIVQHEGDVQGDGVNIAARLQALAEPDTVCISDMVYRDVATKLDLGTVVSLGQPRLKNIVQSFPVYVLLSESPKGLRQTLRVQKVKLKQKKRVWQVAATVLVVGVVSAGTLFLRSRYFPSALRSAQEVTQPGSLTALPLPDKPSLVVLPFVNLSTDPAQEYFSDGLTETLTGDLSQISSLFVIARNSAFTYKGKAVKVQDIGREMGVQYVLEGSVLKADNEVRINVQLIDATTGYHVWSERYDRPLQHILTLQNEIVQKIVTTLKLQLTLQEQGILVRKTTTNLEAYDYLLRGVEYHNRLTKESNVQARQMFEHAIALDPQYAAAYTGLGATYWQEWVWQWNPAPQNLERAFALAQQAVALDDALPVAHGLLGYAYMYKQQYEEGVAEEERAIALDPNNADAYVWLSEILNMAGRPQEAIESATKAMRLNPRYPPFYAFNVGWAYTLTGRYEEAIATLKQVLSRNPNFFSAHALLAASYMSAWVGQWGQDPQMLERALESAQRALALSASASGAHGLLGMAHLFHKQYEQALAEGEQAIALNPLDAPSYIMLGYILACTGRLQQAMEVSEQALRLNPRPPTAYWGIVGLVYNLAGQYEKAVVSLKSALSGSPVDLELHVPLAVAYSELGKEAEARAEGTEVLRLNPNFSLEVHRQRMPIKDPAVLERHLAALHNAGLK